MSVVKANRRLVAVAAVFTMASVPPSARQESRTTVRPRFDVASIKPNNTGSKAVRLGDTPGRFFAGNVTVRMLISLAYNVDDVQIVKRPAWVDVDRFDVEARGDTGATRQQLMSMLQMLLEDRFQLVRRSDKQRLPVYVLLVGQSGPRLARRECRPRDANGPMGPSDLSVCGYLNFGNGPITATSIRMANCAEVLTNILKRKVIDRTGIDGLFDVALSYAVGLSLNVAPSAR
ncbi:MAG: TIGR03435 family protein [Vicinamibacterales bacterium]